jgi:hypothetical protein
LRNTERRTLVVVPREASAGLKETQKENKHWI